MEYFNLILQLKLNAEEKKDLVAFMHWRFAGHCPSDSHRHSEAYTALV